MILFKSPVIFNEEAHTYHLGKEALQGITPIIAWLFPDTYSNIDEETLRLASVHGKHIHQECQNYDEMGIENDDNADYIELTKPFRHIASEYLVSDEKLFASSIDKVYEGSDETSVILADIKATSKLHVENVTVQLSIYAMLFERQNPHIKVERIMAIWLPKRKYGRPKIVDCQRLPSELCKEILDTYANEPWEVDAIREKVKSAFLPVLSDTDVTKFKNLEAEIANIEKQVAVYKAQSDQLRATLLEAMQMYGFQKWEGEHLVVTRKASSKRQSLDSKKVKEQYPDVYQECMKETNVGESIMIKLK